ncbi:hypothetical protein [Nocardia cyriacigeorgica]|uniref:hypothetical protein n=1 Tax=Nocardia cyriacigeorgica TaxID=135487 RepID=UPI0015E2984E|nr:hypothetical protein [Nocardia cyriacigeorgica]
MGTLGSCSLLVVGQADGEGGPAEFLDVGVDAEFGCGGHVVAAVGDDEGVVVLVAEAVEVGVVDGELDEVPFRASEGDFVEIEECRSAGRRYDEVPCQASPWMTED